MNNPYQNVAEQQRMAGYDSQSTLAGYANIRSTKTDVFAGPANVTIEERLRIADKRLSELMERLQILFSKMEPVMDADYPYPECDNAKTPATSAVASKIESISSRINELSNIVVHNTTRIQLEGSCVQEGKCVG